MIRGRTSISDPVACLHIVNHFVLAVFKGIAGLLFNSPALFGDALYSVSDAADAFTEKAHTPDQRGLNSQSVYTGNGTFKLMSAIFFAVFLLVAGLQLVISAVTEMFRGNVAASSGTAGILAGTAVVLSFVWKGAVFQFKKGLFSKTKGFTPENHRYSIYSSIAAMIGVLGSIAGQKLKLPVMLYLDPAAALLVAGFIFLRAYRMIKSCISVPLADEFQEEDVASLIETVQRVLGVITVDDLIAREYGHYVIVAAKISVNPRITVMEANDIADRAKKLLFKRFSHIRDVQIQVMPYDPGYPYKTNYEESGNDISHLLQ